VEIVCYDDEFWTTEMANKLKLYIRYFVICVYYFGYNVYNVYRFYTNCILPEIIDSLFGRRLSVEDISDQPSILEAQKVQNQKMAAKRHVKK